MEYTVPLPPDLNQRFQGMWLANGSLVSSRQYDEARSGFKNIYKMLLDKQPDKSRYHKGHVLHQIGIILVESGNPSEALRYFILAYIEDLLSAKRGEEDKADDTPAGRTLRGGYTVNEAALRQLKDIVREEKSSGLVIQDPESVLTKLAQGKSPADITQSMSTPDLEVGKRKPGEFELDWEKRVFVGGNYSSHLSEINDIKRVCHEMGYDPVIALEFETPQKLLHHHALMLLHECSKAIFEVTDTAGQLMEIERLRDYGYKQKDVLIVSQADAHLTGMLTPLLNAEGYEVHRYSCNSELIKLVKGFLS